MKTTIYGNHSNFSSLVFELKIIEAKNIESKLKGNLFVRIYLPSVISSNNAAIEINIKAISTKNDHLWNESFSLACSGIGDSVDIINLNKQSLVLELWLRNKLPIFGATFGASKLLGRGEIPLKVVLESPNMIFDKWVNHVPKHGHLPTLKVEMRVKILKDEEKRRPRVLGMKNWNECGCKDGHDHGCSCDDYDVFALATALEVL